MRVILAIFLALSMTACGHMTPRQSAGITAAAQLYLQMDQKQQANHMRVVRESQAATQRSNANRQVIQQLYTPQQQNPVNPYSNMKEW